MVWFQFLWSRMDFHVVIILIVHWNFFCVWSMWSCLLSFYVHFFPCGFFFSDSGDSCSLDYVPDNILMLVFERKQFTKSQHVKEVSTSIWGWDVMRSSFGGWGPLAFLFHFYINYFLLHLYEYLSACMYTHHMHAWFLWSLEEGPLELEYSQLWTTM